MKKIMLATGLCVITMLSNNNNAQATFINGSFEDPAYSDTNWHTPESIPGWQTTDNNFEIWSNSFNGVTSYEGNQHAELNAYIDGTLFQDTDTIAAGMQLGFEFAHRGRAGMDTLLLTITDLGNDNVYGGSDDTKLFSKQYSTGNDAWVLYTNEGDAEILASGNKIRFAYTAVESSGGNNSYGNFLDTVNFGVGVGHVPPQPQTSSVPEPTSLFLIGFGLFGLTGLRRHNKKNTPATKS
ncbi:PEP-CTERM protein-sorting domain-containing protein [Candidatus Electrothrix aarhusensis]